MWVNGTYSNHKVSSCSFISRNYFVVGFSWQITAKNWSKSYSSLSWKEAKISLTRGSGRRAWRLTIVLTSLPDTSPWPLSSMRNTWNRSPAGSSELMCRRMNVISSSLSTIPLPSVSILASNRLIWNVTVITPLDKLFWNVVALPLFRPGCSPSPSDHFWSLHGWFYRIHPCQRTEKHSLLCFERTWGWLVVVHMYYLKDIFQKRIVVSNVAVVSLQSDFWMVMSNSKATDDPFRVLLRG